MTNSKKIAIIGGGAAGFFAAISAKEHHPEAEVTIYEKSAKVLSKVKVSGGGRCNVTHACFDNKKLLTFYPRGANYLRKAFEQFNTRSTIEWFKKRGVELETLSDNCIFPKSNSSQTIIDCFLNEARKLGVKQLLQTPINDIHQLSNKQF
jgi:predicted Rossmann fold flavoprotein